MKKVLLVCFFIFTSLVSFAPLVASAQGGEAQRGLDITAKAAKYETGESASLANTVGGMIRAILGLLGVVFVLLLIYGGVRYLTAMGNDENVKEAKNTMIAATIGIVIVVSAYAISLFVVDQLVKIGSPGQLIEQESTGIPGSSMPGTSMPPR